MNKNTENLEWIIDLYNIIKKPTATEQIIQRQNQWLLNKKAKRLNRFFGFFLKSVVEKIPKVLIW